MAIARALRAASPRASVEWVTAEPALTYLRLWGERVLNCSESLETFSAAIEGIFNIHGFSIGRLREYLGILRRNYGVISECVDFDAYDAILADEFWELMLEAPPSIAERVIFATDLATLPYGRGFRSAIISLIVNHYFRRAYLRFGWRVYLNSLEETPRFRWYVLAGPRVAEWVRENMFVAGLATSYLPRELPERSAAREALGVSGSKLVVASVGGTSAGSLKFLSTVVKAVDIARRSSTSNIKLVMVRGPRTPEIEGFRREWVVSHGLLKSLTDLYMAADLLIVRPGRTTTADLECLPTGVKALLVPIKGHSEQEYIAGTVSRRFPQRFELVREGVSPKDLGLRILEALESGRPSASRPGEGECLGSVRAAEYVLAIASGDAGAEHHTDRASKPV